MSGGSVVKNDRNVRDITRSAQAKRGRLGTQVSARLRPVLDRLGAASPIFVMVFVILRVCTQTILR
ncbi:MAG: hypothetical protein BGO28_05450 [Alphaproteobacteria bacterium 43-37]|nr:MAG: hypothetical protein BGO28_05450 [Alphaproteobacteria bacterium 43-37]